MTPRAAWVAAALLGGCATPSHERVILLPDADGGTGKVAVLARGRQTILSEPYTMARTDSRGRVETRVLDPAQVRSEFADLLDGLPPRPVTYQFYFLPDSPLLTPESEAASAGMLADVARRPAVEVNLIGHADTQGGEEHNERLSLTRAMLVRARLVALGVNGFRIRIAGRGEREPAVATLDGVEEARNRRVQLHAR